MSRAQTHLARNRKKVPKLLTCLYINRHHLTADVIIAISKPDINDAVKICRAAEIDWPALAGRHRPDGSIPARQCVRPSQKTSVGHADKHFSSPIATPCAFGTPRPIAIAIYIWPPVPAESRGPWGAVIVVPYGLSGFPVERIMRVPAVMNNIPSWRRESRESWRYR